MTLALEPGARVRVWTALAAAACAFISMPAIAGTIKEQLAILLADGIGVHAL